MKKNILPVIFFQKKLHCYCNPEWCNRKTNMLLYQIVKEFKTNC